jgi:AraC family transcriptional regulator, L-rhamnose operon transcriptional activator RhaR
MAGTTIEHSHKLVHFGDDSFAYAGRHLHATGHPEHTHSFVEVAVVVAGAGVHHSLAGHRRLAVGDVMLLRPGVWHGYRDCADLELYNCCFSAELLRSELAWTREDPLLGHLLWTGPYADQRRGLLTTGLAPEQLAECLEHLDALSRLRSREPRLHRSDFLGRLSLILGCLARAVAPDLDARAGHIHPAVVEAMRRMEARPDRPWTLTELAAGLHLTPGYLVRLFKSATGLPPMAYLSRHRVELAAERLLSGDAPVSAIAGAVGWPDQNYFARRFRAHYGLSASAYRARFTHNAIRMPPRV